MDESWNKAYAKLLTGACLGVAEGSRLRIASEIAHRDLVSRSGRGGLLTRRSRRASRLLRSEARPHPRGRLTRRLAGRDSPRPRAPGERLPRGRLGFAQHSRRGGARHHGGSRLLQGISRPTRLAKGHEGVPRCHDVQSPPLVRRAFAHGGLGRLDPPARRNSLRRGPGPAPRGRPRGAPPAHPPPRRRRPGRGLEGPSRRDRRKVAAPARALARKPALRGPRYRPARRPLAPLGMGRRRLDDAAGPTLLSEYPHRGDIRHAPDARATEGRVACTRPVEVLGAKIEGAWFEFEAGRAPTAAARRATRPSLERYLETDSGASRLGEVALVDSSGPIARSGPRLRQRPHRRERGLPYRPGLGLRGGLHGLRGHGRVDQGRRRATTSRSCISTS